MCFKLLKNMWGNKNGLGAVVASTEAPGVGTDRRKYHFTQRANNE